MCYLLNLTFSFGTTTLPLRTWSTILEFSDVCRRIFHLTEQKSLFCRGMSSCCDVPLTDADIFKWKLFTLSKVLELIHKITSADSRDVSGIACNVSETSSLSRPVFLVSRTQKKGVYLYIVSIKVSDIWNNNLSMSVTKTRCFNEYELKVRVAPKGLYCSHFSHAQMISWTDPKTFSKYESFTHQKV